MKLAVADFNLIFDIIAVIHGFGGRIKSSIFCDEKIRTEIFPPPPVSGNEANLRSKLNGSRERALFVSDSDEF